MSQKADITKKLRQFALVFVILAIVVIMNFLSPVFMTRNNIINIIRQVSINGILAVGMTFVILTGNIDLSVGSVVAMTSVICGSLLEMGFSWSISCVFAILIATLFGILNGYLVAYVGFQSFIASLASMTIVRGLAKAYSNGKPFTIRDKDFIEIGQGYVWGIPIPIIILMFVVAIGLIVLNTTTFGRYVYATGSNKNAAKLSGVRTRLIEIMVYVIAAVCAAIAGIILSARISSGQPIAGEGYELDAIAATAIGGTSMNGGVGSLTGTILGFMILGLMTNSMNLLNINSFYQQIVKGILIIIAVFLDMKSKEKHV